jgi:uncharacterized protein (TIGR01777 family)
VNARHIILAGGSGFLGQRVAAYLRPRNWEPIVLTRSPDASARFTEIAWDAKHCGAWTEALDGADAVINFTGRSVNCRYTPRNRREIMDSRVDSTRVVGEAIARCSTPPRIWLNASTATLYQHTFGPAHDESSTAYDATLDAKDAFSVSVGKAWEKALNDAAVPSTRKVAMRTSIVFGTVKGGVFRILRRLTKLGLGGRMGSGRQYVSWIHEEDFCRAVEWILSHDELGGPVNVTAPNPLTNAEMMAAFRRACGIPIGLPASRWMLEIGAFVMRTETELLLKSRRVVPGKLLASGFNFRFDEFEIALRELEQRLRAEG